MRVPTNAAGEFSETERDRALLARLRQGNERALEELMRAHAPRLGAVAFGLLGRSDLAKDVVQDVFVALWEQRDVLDIRSTLGGYLNRAVRNRAFNLLRHERHHADLADGVAMFDPGALLHARNTAEQVLDDADVTFRLLRALERVAPQPRRVFLLSWHAGLEYSEIADLLGVTVPSVYKMMYRATQRLAELLPSERLD